MARDPSRQLDLYERCQNIRAVVEYTGSGPRMICGFDGIPVYPIRRNGWRHDAAAVRRLRDLVPVSPW